MNTDIRFLPLLLIIPAFAGCLDDPLTQTGPRLGDERTIRLAASGYEVTTKLVAVETLELPGYPPCKALVLEVTYGRDATGTNRFCLTPGAESLRITRTDQEATGETYTRYSYGAYGLFYPCAIACEKVIGRTLTNIYPPDQEWHGELVATEEPGVYEQHGVETYQGVTTYWNTTWDFSDGPYPAKTITEQVSPAQEGHRERFEQVLEWEQTSLKRGNGEVLTLAAEPLRPVQEAHGGIVWSLFPPTAGAPFVYPIERAYSQMQLNDGAMGWLADHPDAFVAVAAYGTFDHIESDSVEHRWDLLWADGHDRLAVACHELEQQVAGIPITTEAACYDERADVSEHALNRTDLPESTQSWGSVQDVRNDIAGKELPIRAAFWTAFDTEPNLAGREADDRPLGRFTVALDYHRGTFDTNNDSPNWGVLPPSGISHAAPRGWSMFDGTTGKPFFVTVPD